MARWIVILALGFGCGGDGDDDGTPGDCAYGGTTYPVGASWPAADGCNTCQCSADVGVQCTTLACPDASTMACAPGGGCPSGPACGAGCCGVGERCYLGMCQCGTTEPCGPGDTCEAFGPGTGCGAICCGASGPCPQ